MTAAPDLRKRDLAAIHIAKAQLGLDDGTYRDTLWTVARVRSAADLDFAGRKAVLDHLRSRGGSVNNRAKRGSDDPMIGKMRALWHDLHLAGKVRNPDGLDSWVKRQTTVDSLSWLSSRQMATCVEALKKWLQRPVTVPAADE